MGEKFNLNPYGNIILKSKLKGMIDKNLIIYKKHICIDKRLIGKIIFDLDIIEGYYTKKNKVYLFINMNKHFPLTPNQYSFRRVTLKTKKENIPKIKNTFSSLNIFELKDKNKIEEVNKNTFNNKIYKPIIIGGVVFFLLFILIELFILWFYIFRN